MQSNKARFYSLCVSLILTGPMPAFAEDAKSQPVETRETSEPEKDSGAASSSSTKPSANATPKAGKAKPLSAPKQADVKAGKVKTQESQASKSPQTNETQGEEEATLACSTTKGTPRVIA